MKVSLTEKQFQRFQTKFVYESILDDMVFKLSLITENDGKTEPDMEWDFTKVKQDIDFAKKWVQTKKDAQEFVEKLSNKIKNLPPKVKRKILRYVLFSFIGLISLEKIDNLLDSALETAVKQEKEIIKNVVKDLRIRKSSDKLLDHMKWEEGSLKHKGEPVLTAYNLGDNAKTIGYGHAVFPDEEESFEFLPRYSKIIPGKTTITKKQAETLLKDDIKEAESIINRILDQWEKEGIKPQITQSMYDAMVSMAYNIGPGIRTSDFIQYVKRGDLKGAKEEILNTSSHLFDEYLGLKTRREREHKMFV